MLLLPTCSSRNVQLAIRRLTVFNMSVVVERNSDLCWLTKLQKEKGTCLVEMKVYGRCSICLKISWVEREKWKWTYIYVWISPYRTRFVGWSDESSSWNRRRLTLSNVGFCIVDFCKVSTSYMDYNMLYWLLECSNSLKFVSTS